MQKQRYLLHFGTNPGFFSSLFQEEFPCWFCEADLVLFNASLIRCRKSAIFTGSLATEGNGNSNNPWSFPIVTWLRTHLCRKHHWFTNALMDQKEHPTNSKSNNLSKIQWDLTNGPLRKLVAGGIRCSGLGVRSMCPVGDFLDEIWSSNEVLLPRKNYSRPLGIPLRSISLPVKCGRQASAFILWCGSAESSGITRNLGQDDEKLVLFFSLVDVAGEDEIR